MVKRNSNSKKQRGGNSDPNVSSSGISNYLPSFLTGTKSSENDETNPPANETKPPANETKPPAGEKRFWFFGGGKKSKKSKKTKRTKKSKTQRRH
jgi:hypothetical protein